MEQGAIPFPLKQEEIQMVKVLECKDLKEALRLCVDTSGIPRCDIAFQLGIHEKYFSRMLADNDDDNRHFPPNLIDKLMDICRNETPLQWQNYTRGYGMHKLKSTLELEVEQLKVELEQERREREAVLKALKEIRGI